MAGVIPARILVHTATPLVYDPQQTDPPEWIEGEPGESGGGEPTPGDPFACVLFMPGPGGEQPDQYRPRVIRQPTLLYNPTRELQRSAVNGIPALVADHTTIKVGQEDELLIAAPELAAWTGAETVRWQAVGLPQPFGRPGTVMGLMAFVRKVDN